MFRMMIVVGQVCLLVGLVIACGEEGETNGANVEGVVSSCDACGDTQVCLRTNGSELVIECVAIPDECDGTADCFDDTCAAALYEMCGADFINTGCSDTFPPTVVSCNP
jgi:hypothetical protein